MKHLVRKVVSFGSTAHIKLPIDLIGERVYVITESDYNNENEFIEKAIIRQRILDSRVNEIEKDFTIFKNSYNLRLLNIEKLFDRNIYTKDIREHLEKKETK